MIRSKGEAGTGDIVEAVRHLRRIRSEIRALTVMDLEELPTAAKVSIPSATMKRSRLAARPAKVPLSASAGEAPWPGRSTATTSR